MSETVLPELLREWTFDDLARLPEDGHRYEIVDGGLYVAPPPTPGTSSPLLSWGYALTLAAPAELEVVAGVGVDLGKSTLVPDVVVLRSSALLGRAVVVSPTDVLLAIEIVSPSWVSRTGCLHPRATQPYGSRPTGRSNSTARPVPPSRYLSGKAITTGRPSLCRPARHVRCFARTGLLSTPPG